MPDSPDNLVEQLDVAGPVLVTNGWVSRERWVELDLELRISARPVPIPGRSAVSSALLERKILTREQASDLDALLLSQRLFKEFRLERKLGSGGMGTVFLARHEPSGRQVALKTMNARLAEDQGFVERFHREARALESLDHPNVARIIASGEQEGHCWLAMEYIEGPSLMTLLKQHKVLPEVWCLQVTRQIAAGLGYVWSSAGLVHRDLKPENILVTSGDLSQPPVAKLIDFGLVKNNREDERLTQTGMTIGTPLYMSPEQVRGEKLDNRSDIYGLGATLYHLITGGTPYNGSSPGTIMSAHLTEPVPDPCARVPSLSSTTRSVIMMAMAKSPEHRFMTGEALAAACDQALDSLEPTRGDAPRLLRKPLVLKAPRREGERTPLANEVLPPLPLPTPEPPRRPVSERRPAIAEGDSTRRGLPPVVPEASAPAHPPKTPAPIPRPAPPRKVKTPLPQPPVRPGITPTPMGSVAQRAATEASTPPTSPSAVQDQGGVGLLPWVVLGGAIVALLFYLFAW